MTAAAIAGGTKIEWADFTFNPWQGCEKVSLGCAHCYAETQAGRFTGGLWGAGHGFRFASDDYWRRPLRWARTAPAKLGRRPRVFCASMADVFEDRDELVDERKRLFELIYRTLELDWLLLTKRPENVGRMLGPAGVGLYAVADRPVPRPQPNVWIGVSIENARHTWRADVLREIPAAVRFISAEPLLGSLFPPARVEVDARYGPEAIEHLHLNEPRRAPLSLAGIDWVIVGGESGRGARPMHLTWARELVAASEASGVAVFVKQLGRRPVERHPYIAGVADAHSYLGLRDRKGGDPDEWPPDLRIREHPRSPAT